MSALLFFQQINVKQYVSVLPVKICMALSIIHLKVPVSNPTSTAKRELLWKMARLCHDTTCLPPILTFAHIPCQTSEGGEVTHTADSSWSDISRLASSVASVDSSASASQSPRRLKTRLAPNRSSDRTPALTDATLCCTTGKFEAGACSC